MAKNPYSELTEDFKESINNATDDEINQKIAETAKNQAALEEAKEKDEDLKEKKAQASEAGAVYRDGKKANNQKIKYAREVLSGRGKDAGDSGLEE